MVNRWTRKIVAFLHDPPGKALVLRSVPHTPHAQLAEALQHIALGRPADASEKTWARKADHIASAADRINLPPEVTVYWDKVKPVLTHPLATGTKPQDVLLPASDFQALDEEIQEKAARQILEPWVQQLAKQSNKEQHLYLRLWRLLYEELGRQTSLKHWIHLLPADTRQPDHSLEQHLSISAALADALPAPSFMVFSIGPVQDFIAAARRTQDLWMGSWILSFLSWKAMESLAEVFGPDVIVFPSLRGQPLCDYWLSQHYGITNGSLEAIHRPTFPNRFLALLPFDEAKKAAQKAEKTVQDAWCQLSEDVYNALKHADFFPANREIHILWESQIQHLLEIYWVVFPWPGADQPNGETQAKLSQKLYEQLCYPPEDWPFRQTYNVLEQSGQYVPNWGTVYSLLYELTDRASGTRKNLRNFDQAKETGDKCTQCGQRAALRVEGQHSWKFWEQVARKLNQRGRYEVRPEGKERLCAICTVKRFAQRDVLEEKLSLRSSFPSTSEMAAVSFKKRVLEALQNDDRKVQQAIRDFLQITHPHLASVASGAIPYLENYKRHLGESERKLAEKLFQIDGEWLQIESWTEKRLQEVWPDIHETDIERGKEVLGHLQKAVNAKPARYYAILYMDGDHMGRWLSATHEKLASFGDILHPEVRSQLEKDPLWQPLIKTKRIITPAVHAAISQALGSFALRLVPHIVEERYAGRLIYAGGDDVLALVPLEDALAVVRELRAAFSGHIHFEDNDLKVRFERETTGYVTWKDDIMLTMGPEATASIGLIFAHHLQPLDLVLQAVRRAERTAKQAYDRNALAVEVLKRSGEPVHAGTKWYYNGISDVVDLLLDVIYRLQHDQIGRKWPYSIQGEAPALEALSPEAQKAEIKRLLLRHAGEKIKDPKIRKQQAEELSERLTMLAKKIGFDSLSQWLLVCSFIAQGGKA